MAIIKKTLSAENLDRISVLVNDTDVNSKYFKVTELPDTFTGGKNAFLIQGSEYLVADTLIKIEIKDAQGNIIYHEPGEGIVSASVGGEPIVTEYYEGVSKVVSVYVYPNRTLDTNGNYSDGTAYGPCTITILGELSKYDNNGTDTPIPLNWEGKYNVKWQKTINVNPALANTTKVRFYRRPTVSIFETLSPIYAFDATGSKVASNVTQSFANIKVSQLDTFAGDVKRIKVYRTSEGDISDYDLIQDILVESKELLSTTALSGSVVGTAGLFTSEVVKKLWNTGSLNALLTSSRVDNGLRLTGAGKFTYTSSLNLADVSVYEFGIDAFYSSSTSSDLQIYLSGSNNGEVLIGTLGGISPTKNLKDTIIQFSLNKSEPTASLYLSQSQGEWHVGNLTLQLTQDTAFSPSEVSFVTSMPTVIGNETYNFKFEFYDVNNNYVPVAVTQSALFTGGNNNIGGTLTFISSSASQSLADLTRVSSSISGTIVVTSGSISGSLSNVSSSVSGTIVTLSGSVSGTIGNVSSSVSGTITTLSGSVSGSIFTLSGSVSTSIKNAKAEAYANVQKLANGDFPGTFIDSSSIYSPVIGGQLGYFSTLFKVGSGTSIYLDARQSPRKIFIGGVVDPNDTTYSEKSGSFNNTNTAVYLDSTGKFSLKNKLAWDGDALTIQGTLKVSDGTGVLAAGGAATDVNNNSTTIAGDKIRTGLIQSNNHSGTADGSDYSTAGMSIDLTGGGISAKNFRITAGGSAYFKGDITGASGTFSGALSGATISGGTIAIGSGNSIFKADTNGIYLGNTTFGSAPFRVTPGGAVTASDINITGGYVSGWQMDGTKIYNSNVQIDNTNSRIDFLSGGSVKTRISNASVSIGSIATAAITIPAQAAAQQFYQGDGSVYGAVDRTFTLSQSIPETGITTPSGVTGNRLSLKIPAFTVGTLGVVNFTAIGNAITFNYGYKAYITYKVSSAPGASGDIASGTYYYYNGYFNDFTGITSGGQSFTLPGVTGGSIPVYSGTATSGQVFYVSATYYIQILTRANAATNYPPTPVNSTVNWNVASPGWTQFSSNAVIVAVANRAEYGSNGIQIGTGDGNYAAMGDAAGSGLSGLFNGSVQIYGTLTAALASSSDRRAKTNIRPIQNATETLKKLNPVSFDWLQHQINTEDFKHSYGFIADEVQPILPNLVLEKRGLEYDDFKYLDYNSFHALAIKAILELTEKVEKLEAQISGSNNQIEEVI